MSRRSATADVRAVSIIAIALAAVATGRAVVPDPLRLDTGLILALAPPNNPPSEQEIEECNRRQMARNDPRALAAVQRGNRQQAVTPDEIRAMKTRILAIVGSEDPVKAGVENRSSRRCGSSWPHNESIDRSQRTSADDSAA